MTPLTYSLLYAEGHVSFGFLSTNNKLRLSAVCNITRFLGNHPFLSFVHAEENQMQQKLTLNSAVPYFMKNCPAKVTVKIQRVIWSSLVTVTVLTASWFRCLTYVERNWEQNCLYRKPQI